MLGLFLLPRLGAEGDADQLCRVLRQNRWRDHRHGLRGGHSRLYGTPDFYMLGTSSSTALKIVGALIIAGGMMMPIEYVALRFLTRKNRKEH